MKTLFQISEAALALSPNDFSSGIETRVNDGGHEMKLVGGRLDASLADVTGVLVSGGRLFPGSATQDSIWKQNGLWWRRRDGWSWWETWWELTRCNVGFYQVTSSRQNIALLCFIYIYRKNQAVPNARISPITYFKIRIQSFLRTSFLGRLNCFLASVIWFSHLQCQFLNPPNRSLKNWCGLRNKRVDLKPAKYR